MPEPSFACGHRYNLPEAFLRDVTHVRALMGWACMAKVWAELALLGWAAEHLSQGPYFWGLYPLLAFLIAGRQGSLLQLIHESAHNLLLPSRKWNHRAAKWFCALPIGVFIEGYTRGHRRHHAHTNTAKDPESDREKYKIVDFRDPRLFLLLLKDLSGLTALTIFFDYKRSEVSNEVAGKPPRHLIRFLQLCLVQAFLLGGPFHWNLVAYALLWLFPAMSAHMFLMRIRGIAEHGLATQLGKKVERAAEGTYYTRSFLTSKSSYRFLPLIWVEKALIGSFSVHYHHEHHLFPGVPHYQLTKVHARISAMVQTENPDVYAKGYFAAALRNLGLKAFQSRTKMTAA